MRDHRYSFHALLLAGSAVSALSVADPARADDADQAQGTATSDGQQTGKKNDLGQVIISTTRINPDLQARELMRNADNIRDVTLSAEIQRLPDANIAEALQRIPGISMESDSGAGRFITIRGFDADQWQALRRRRSCRRCRIPAFDARLSGESDGR
jgi:outer membrane receptor for Fe3+-dicitrate